MGLQPINRISFSIEFIPYTNVLSSSASSLPEMDIFAPTTMEKLLSVSIVIPCRNEEKYIEQNVRSIIGQEYDGSIETIVVDGQSDDRTQEIVAKLQKEYPDKIKLIENPQRFTPHALNLGIEASKSDVFIILGGHAYLEKDFVRRNVEALNADPSVGCAGGIIRNIDENETSAVISKAMASIFGVGNATFRTGGKKGYVDTVAFGAYRREVYDKIGGFDEALVRNQDDEYNFRVISAGYKILFDPEIVSNYYVRGSFKKLWKQYYQYGYWKVYVNRKHRRVTTVRQLFPALMVSGIVFGILISPLWWGFGLLTSTVVTIYILLGIIFSILSTNKLEEVGLILFTFLILHFSYGLGYIAGIANFLLMSKDPGEGSKEMSRD